MKKVVSLNDVRLSRAAAKLDGLVRQMSVLILVGQIAEAIALDDQASEITRQIIQIAAGM